MDSWASIYQKDPELFNEKETPLAKPEGAERVAFEEDLKAGLAHYGGEAYDKSRSAAETEGFRYALHETMGAGLGIRGLALTRTSRTSPRGRSGP